MKWTQRQIDDALRKVVERCMTDADYRALALKDAAAAIAKVTPEPLGDFRVRFVDNTGYDVTVVLPSSASDLKGELTEDELAEVAGGLGPPMGPTTTDEPPTVNPTSLPTDELCPFTTRHTDTHTDNCK